MSVTSTNPLSSLIVTVAVDATSSANAVSLVVSVVLFRSPPVTCIVSPRPHDRIKSVTAGTAVSVTWIVSLRNSPVRWPDSVSHTVNVSSTRPAASPPSAVPLPTHTCTDIVSDNLGLRFSSESVNWMYTTSRVEKVSVTSVKFLSSKNSVRLEFVTSRSIAAVSNSSSDTDEFQSM